MRILKIICVIVLLPLFVHAQTTYVVNGIIQSTNDGSLVGANIVLTNLKQNKDKFGVTSGSEGDFSISVKKGTYTLEVSFVGYTKYTTNVEVKGDITLPVIVLSEDSQLMDEVVVTARTITYNTEGYVAEVYKNPLYKNMDMTSVLKMSPGTHATHNGVQVFGQNVSKIYLNGRELNLYGEQLIAYLEAIDAKNVKTMEVVTATGVEDDAVNKGKSIIKITTINPETGGMANWGLSSMNGDSKHLHGMNASVNWRIDKHWGMYFNANGAFGNSTQGTRTETHFYDTDERRISESTLKNKLNHNVRTVLGISYDLDANNLFSIEGTFQQNKNSNPATSSVRNLKNGVYADVADGSDDAVRKFDKYNLSFIYTHKFNKDAQLEFNADRMGTNVDENSLQRYRYAAGDDTGYDLWSLDENLIHTARLDFTQSFKALKGKLSVGVKGTWLQNESHTDYAVSVDGVQDDVTSYADLYNYKEDVYAAYAKYGLTFGNLSMDFGMRMEHARISPESSSNPERNYSSNYTDFFPEVGLNYVINKDKGHNISLSYDRGIGRPSMDALNPLVRRINEYSYSMGNPLLKANYYDYLQMTTVLFSKYTLNVRYAYSDNGSMGLSEMKDGILYSTTRTGKKNTSLRANLSAPVKMAKWLNVRFSANYHYNKTSFLDDKDDFHYWSVGYFSTFRLPYDIMVSHDLYFSSSDKSLYSESKQRPTCNVVIQKNFPKQGLNLGLSFMDIFNTFGGQRMDTFRDDFYQISKGIYNNFGISFRVGYNLRWGKKSSVRRASAGNSSEANRVASE